jgi:D-alanyl-lipoteichoic acid acyltransferase DltB (MBOAT superfamily)
LSTWLKDYIYIPLGGSRCSKLRSYWNIVVTFLVSGIWHGANWTFIIWGLLHGLFQIIEKVLNMQKCNSKGFVKVGRILLTFTLVNFTWIFFRMPDFDSSIEFLLRIFTNHDSGLFIDFTTLTIGGAALLVVVIKEICEEIKPSFSLFSNKNTVIRWMSYIIVTVLLLLLGVFDASQFIYINF